MIMFMDPFFSIVQDIVFNRISYIIHCFIPFFTANEFSKSVNTEGYQFSIKSLCYGS